MIEENKKKYLDMLATKLFLNEDEVIGLTKGSRKHVITICPLCRKERVQQYSDVVRNGRTLCKHCARIIKAQTPFLGQRSGRLLIYDFGTPHYFKSKQQTTFKALCDCGKDGEYVAYYIKSGDTSSCGCLHIDGLKEMVGEKHPNWNPERSEEERAHKRPGSGVWAKEVKKRDEHTCQVCGSNKNLVAHHLESYKDRKDLRNEIGNGVTMCRECHVDFHTNFMGNYRVPCTSEDFEEYLMQV